MNNTRRIAILLLTGIILFFTGCGTKHRKFVTEFSGFFGTSTVVTGYAETETEFVRFARIIYDKTEELHRLYDIYNEYDGVNNICTVNKNAGIAPVPVDENIISMLRFAREGYDLTNGKVNIAMGSVLRIWHAYRDEGVKIPPVQLLKEAAKNTDIADMIIDGENSTVFLKTEGMSLDVGAVAKGYAAQLAANAAKDAGMSSGIINAGGSVTVIGRPLDGLRQRFGVGIQDPDLDVNDMRNIIDTVFIQDATVSSSGSYQRKFVIDGTEYNHIIDPDTLFPASRYRQVTVIHEDAGMADLLSTALFILPYEDGALLAEKRGARVLWADSEDNRLTAGGYDEVSKTLSGYSALD